MSAETPTTPAVPLTRRALRAMAAGAAVAADRATEATTVAERPEVSAPEPETPQPSDVTITQVETDAATPEVSGDAFAAAAKLFGTSEPTQTGPTAVRVESAEAPAAEDELPEYMGTSPRRPRSNFRRVTTTAFSVGVVGIVGALGVAMALPAVPMSSSAIAATTTSTTTNLAVASGGTDVASASNDIQAYVAPADAPNPQVQRSENYATASGAELAAAYHITNYTSAKYTNNISSPIQWPFAVGVSWSYGYGMRDGVLHEGIDFTPGDGAEVQAIADGTVRIATEDGGAYGVNVYIDHIIDGQLITSHYAHMQYGSLRVKAGDKVTVGTIIGLTGNTGRSFGAHTHFELIKNGSTFDPLPWLAEHAGGYHGG